MSEGLRRTTGRPFIRAGLLAAACLALAPSIAHAQTPGVPATLDVVVLRDGTRLVGRVIKEDPGHFVIVETPDHRRHTVSEDLVREVNVAAPVSIAPPRVDEAAFNQAWSARGGQLFTYEGRAEIIGAVFPTESFPVTGTCATGIGVSPVSIYGQTSLGRGSGGGTGLGARVGYMRLALPKRSSDTTWWAFRAGSGLDLGFLYGRLPTSVPVASGELCAQFQKNEHDVDYSNQSILLVQVPLNLGVHVGIGSFRDQATWHGVVLGAAWAPAFTYVKPSMRDGRGAASYLGLELSLDFTTLHAAVDKRPEQHFRAAALILPATADGAPFMATLSFGAVWY